MTWFVPVTQRVPSGLSTRWQRFSHSVLNSWFSSGPRDLSQSPLSHFTLPPAAQGGPPRAARLVPVALVHLHHAPGVAGDAAVGQEVRGIGEHQIEHAARMPLGDG